MDSEDDFRDHIQAVEKEGKIQIADPATPEGQIKGVYLKAKHQNRQGDFAQCNLQLEVGDILLFMAPSSPGTGEARVVRVKNP